AGNAHALGHWIHYADDPGLADLVILKPDWLSVAIGLVQEDGETIRHGGLLPHRRLAAIWNDLVRPAEHRYPNWQQRIFLRLMERFELSYQVNDGAGAPLSLVAQLVPADPPGYEEQWTTAVPAEREVFQECRIIESRSNRAADPEGLMFRLIVRFHRHSLGRENVADSVHWRDGLLLRDRYGARALVTLDPNRGPIPVRGVYPHGILSCLMQEVRDCIEDFWKGLATQVLVPCQASCPWQAPGSGMFDLDKLYSRRHRGKPDFPCPVPDCDHDAEIDELLQGIEQRTSSGPTDPAEASTAAVEALVEQHTSRVLA